MAEVVGVHDGEGGTVRDDGSTVPSVLDGFRSNIDATAEFMAQLPQVHSDPVHRFAEGLYCRELTMPADTVWLSRVHKHENFTFVMTGECSVVTEKGLVRIKAPYFQRTEAGTQRVLHIHEESTWVTVHAMPDGMTEYTPIEEIEEYFACDNLDQYDKYLISELLRLEGTP